ncbi:MAG: CaiB/BaiF CoA transferase family protein [Syntrophobacteraceae bacterium]
MAGPINGLKILDFTTLLPGPYATMCLADLGAEVIQITSGSRPDLMDFVPPFLPGTKISAAAAYLRRNKRSMTLNLKDLRAVEIVHQLLGSYDIVIEQFRPGVMSRLGLDYQSLRRVNPSLIYCSLTGYGHTGPLRDRAGHDINYIARSGVASYSGKTNSGPSLMGMQIADVAAGSSNAVIGILAAVASRHITGEGQSIDISMTDGMIAFNATVGAAFLVDGEDPQREGTLLNGGTLYDYYETKDRKHISFGGLEPQFFANFCNAIGRPDLIPGGVSPVNTFQVKEEVRAIVRTRTRDEWTALFNATDACVEPVKTLSEVMEDALVQERGMVVEVPLPSGEVVRQLANPIKFSGSTLEYRQAGSTPGAHTKEVLRDLGYSDEEIGDFEKSGLFK